MALGSRLNLSQSQSLVMTPELQQAIKLLSLSTVELGSFVSQALENNPLLKEGDLSEELTRETDQNDLPRAEITADSLTQPIRDRPESNYGSEWGAGSEYEPLNKEHFDRAEQRTSEPSLEAYLQQQVGAYCNNEKTVFIARHIIGLLDDAGYLLFDLSEVAIDLGVSIEETEQALSIVQQLEPNGVGARSLSECLMIQAREMDRCDPCMKLLIENLAMLALGEIKSLKKICGVDDEDFAEMLKELRSYDPKPGHAFGESTLAPVVPDVYVTEKEDNSWEVKLNDDILPKLVVNRSYALEIQETGTDSETELWLNDKLSDASWLIKALDQRQKTILKTASEIVRQQEGFFRKGVSALRPLTLKIVADAIKMHESTVSRVTKNKFISCKRGTFELKYFFTSGVEVKEGGDASAEAVKAHIKRLTDAESANKVLSDDKLVGLLKEMGFNVARRTVTKYREAIGVGSSVERRRQKKLRDL